MTTSTSAIYSALLNHFKPHRAEALYRIRVNGFCLVTGILLTYLLPIPSLHEAIGIVRGYPESASGEGLYGCFCILEVVALTLFSINFLHGIYAVNCPRASLPPIASPNRPKGIRKASLTPQRPFKLLSPQSSPQTQKPFSFSPSSSFGRSMTTNYPTSPASTPSRVVHYTAPPTNSSTTSQASNSSSINILSTPSPVISAYRGKHLSNSVGRALDGSFLGQFTSNDRNDDD
ncbi:hypothetical protein AGABI1DRAFT_69829 [Agaricus bisporus var. burnettii JB137-S8]|uniref:Uncharacterized protein n=2 Tax=Agaricus bisporus var. burnettii TaxID=192524 RepID=K5XDY7_AGABU|nr:uncharacterized protein AGABI1DRAFT_69829 [Agaricus bisporus var. burnettii JB137-S8]EKM81548.1 hypothetical protein AGABI1DRAFT_69829 [Agaricus bisporus var. burnettii JB137-S8]KAF7770274.1 hypothetical protein Agabi119p4_6248 [Agaricus bisporus var. burnettii]